MKPTIEKDNIHFTLREDNILYIECLPNTIMTIDEGKLSTEIGLELNEGNPGPLFCDLTNVVKMTKECRKHFSSPISRIIGNFFLGANKPIRPTRLFTKKTEAIKWLTK